MLVDGSRFDSEVIEVFICKLQVDRKVNINYKCQKGVIYERTYNFTKDSESYLDFTINNSYRQRCENENLYELLQDICDALIVKDMQNQKIILDKNFKLEDLQKIMDREYK